MNTPTPQRVAVSRAECGALAADGHAIVTTGTATRALLWLVVPRTEAGARLQVALACLRTPEDAPRLLSADKARRLADRTSHYSERASITLADIYSADARRTSPAIASLAERTPVPHPLHGVAYADGVHSTRLSPRLPWRKVAP